MIFVDESNSFETFYSRLKTFSNWRNTQITKELLAHAGFVFTEQDDIVICPFCKVEGFRWSTGDNPLADHRSWSPNCSYIQSIDSCNVNENHTNVVNGIDECTSRVVVIPDSKDESRSTTEKAFAELKIEDEQQNKNSITTAWCKVCYAREIQILFLPCKHIAVCVQCSSDLEECVICREPLQEKLRTYLA